MHGVSEGCILQVGQVCAEVVKVSKHPNADRLKVLQVRTDIETLQVVTNAPNVREGLRVAFAVWLASVSSSPSTTSAVFHSHGPWKHLHPVGFTSKLICKRDSHAGRWCHYVWQRD